MSSYAEKPIQKTDDRVYHSFPRNESAYGPAYIVDPKVQLCFAAYAFQAGPAITVIPCENLAKDPKWAAVISWVKK
jgi:hypothetical protein